jgi:hypothetical protein
VSADSGGLSIYEDNLSGMEIAGFESARYFAFLVSDLSQNQVLQLARGLAPALDETLRTTALKGFNRYVFGALFQVRRQCRDG